MKHLILTFSLVSALFSLPALAQDAPEVDAEALRALEHRAQGLRSDTGESWRRLQGIALALGGDDGAAHLTINHTNRVGAFYQLLSARYLLDGQPLMMRSTGDGDLSQFNVYDGALAVGPHVLSVELTYRGRAELFRYVEGYAFRVTHARTFEVTPGGHVTLDVEGFGGGEPLAPYGTLHVGIRQHFEANDPSAW